VLSLHALINCYWEILCNYEFVTQLIDFYFKVQLQNEKEEKRQRTLFAPQSSIYAPWFIRWYVPLIKNHHPTLHRVPSKVVEVRSIVTQMDMCALEDESLNHLTDNLVGGRPTYNPSESNTTSLLG
jgi:hypothetical protein